MIFGPCAGLLGRILVPQAIYCLSNMWTQKQTDFDWSFN